MLDQLQKNDEVALWGGEEPKGSVLACDFYNGGAVACLSDQDIIDLLMKELLPAAVPGSNTPKSSTRTSRDVGRGGRFSPARSRAGRR